MFRFSRHASNGHSGDEWNARTIKAAYDQGKLYRVETLPGTTADVVYGYAPDGTCVGMIVGKNGVIITAFAAPEEYWQSV